MTAALDRARAVADAVLFEGYLLYPYRASAAKNTVRWQWGVLMPPAVAAGGTGEHDDCHAELLADPDNVLRISDLLSGADNQYAAGTGAHPLVGRWVPDFAVINDSGTQRIAELARGGRPPRPPG